MNAKFLTSTSALLMIVGLGAVGVRPGEAVPGWEEKLVDAGSYRLNFRIIPGDGPVVLLEAGGGLDAGEWNDLGPRIAEVTGATVVAYDRPGFGQSDLPDIPCDMREESQSLWRALGGLGLDHDVVLVGHSYGGWMVRLHANDHPDRVAGLVLIDPFNTEFVESLGIPYCDQHPYMGKPSFDSSAPQELTKQQRAEARMAGQGLGPKVALMRETKIPGGIPVRLITSMKPFWPKAAEGEAWRRAHERIVAATPGAVLVEATESGHMVPWDQPDLVLEQIAAVVTAAGKR